MSMALKWYKQEFHEKIVELESASKNQKLVKAMAVPTAKKLENQRLLKHIKMREAQPLYGIV